MPRLRFVSADYSSSTSAHARVEVAIEIEGEQKVAIGEYRDKFEASVFEAARNAIVQLTGLCPDVQGMIITAGGGRKKCEAVVELTTRKNNQRIVGRAEHCDSFQANIAAYIDALNKL